VGTEEGAEAELLGRLRDSELVGVRSALLGFGEDAKVHASIVSSREGSVRREPFRAPPSAGSMGRVTVAAPALPALPVTTSPVRALRVLANDVEPSADPRGEGLAGAAPQ